jgi:hypothetical protein
MMKKVNISQVDALFSDGSYSIEFLFYYKGGLNTRRLRSALRRLSSSFWPVFGEYRDGVISFDKYHEEGGYAEEVSGQEFDTREVEEGRSDALSRFRLPDFERLFFLKTIQFKNGTAIVPKLKHLAGDGYSYFYFLSRLAALTGPTPGPLRSFLARLTDKPHHRRTILRDFFFKDVQQKPALRDERFTIELDEVPRADVGSIIKDAAAADHRRISSNDVLSAMAIKKLVARRGEAWGESLSLTMPIDVRPQIKEYGRRFFGNGLMFHTVEMKKEEAESLQAREIALKIRASMPSVRRQTYMDYLGRLEETIAEGRAGALGPYDPSRGGLVTNLSKLPWDRLDFGTGGPDLVLPLTTGKNAAAILAKEDNYILRLAY